jgi:hypothetical protein
LTVVCCRDLSKTQRLEVIHSINEAFKEKHKKWRVLYRKKKR